MKKSFTAAVIALGLTYICSAENKPEAAGGFEIQPIEHASMVIRHGSTTIYVDPVGDVKQYDAFPKPDIILITHIHGDHLSPDLISKIRKAETTVLAPKSVKEQFKDCRILNSGETDIVNGISIEAVPAYNLTEDRLKYHPKARGDNGYILQSGTERLYISGDTEDIKEMRGLKEIDHAIVCMNLPYTMTEEQAASAVLEMKPKKVTPYHYRGKSGISDLKRFQKLLKDGNPGIQVKLLNWYPKQAETK